MVLLDTNIISETMKLKPNATVIDWLKKREKKTCICVISIEEMKYGQMLMPEGRSREVLDSDIKKVVDLFSGSILLYDESAAMRCAEFHSQAIHSGRTPALGDMMIAAVASVNDLCLATRNVKDFSYLPIDIVNPFEE